MSKYNLNDIFEEMSQKDKDFDSAQAMDKLTKDDQDKLKMIKMMMDKEKEIDIIKKISPKADRKSLEKLSKMEEARVDSEVAERIEGMLDRSMKTKFIDAFMDIYSDLLEEDNFFAEDIINHLNNEMHAELDGYQRQGDRLAGIGESSDKYVDEIGEGAMQPGEGDLESGQTGNMDAYTEEMDRNEYAPEVKERLDMVELGLKKSNRNFRASEIKMYTDSLFRDFERGEFEDYDDYTIEDHEEELSNMIADKGLKEHFGRFMKKYQ